MRGCPSPFSSSSCSSDWHSSSSGSFPSPLPWRDWMECLAGVSRYSTAAVCCSFDVSLSPRVLRLWPARDCWPTPCQTWGCRQYTRVPAVDSSSHRFSITAFYLGNKLTINTFLEIFDQTSYSITFYKNKGETLSRFEYQCTNPKTGRDAGSKCLQWSVL